MAALFTSTHSARREPATKQKSLLLRLTVATSGGMFMDGFVFASIAVVMAGQMFRTELGVTTLWQSLISASTLVGTILGSPIAGWVTDRFGRRPMFTTDLCVFLVSAVLMYFVQAPWQVGTLGLIMGIAVGADYAIGSPMLGEFATAESRGRYLTVLEIFWNVGYVVAFFVGYLITQADPNGWRWALAAGAIPALIILLARHGLPESPRWLLSKGRREEAARIVEDDLGLSLDDAEFNQETDEHLGWRALFNRDYLARTVFSCVFWICIVLPYFALTFFQTDVLRTLGIGNPLTSALLGTLVALVGAVTSWFLVDSIGRRTMLILPMFVTAAALAIVSLNSVLPASVTVLCFFVYLFFYGIMSVLPGVYPLELFPTAVRTTGVGIAAAASRVGAAIGTFLLPLIMAGFGFAATMLVMALVCLIGAVSSMLLAPETNGRSLSETAGRTAIPRPRRNSHY